ncbi:MAG: glycosyltransferase family 4 protein [Terracidiphilus sp.]
MRVFVLLFAISALITAGVRKLLGRHGLMDLPNARSSHAVPVPRGGGVGIVVAFLSAVAWIFARHVILAGLAWALIGGGVAIAIVGFLDDRFRLSAWPRIVVHSLAAAWAVWCLDAMHPAQFSEGCDAWAWVRRCAAFVALVWLTNLFNFMDGIDGLAGMEAVCVSGFGAVLLQGNGLPGGARLSLMLTAASLGFLVWNWPPAKIFMGDVGSGFLGFTLGTLALFSAKTSPKLIWPWLILLATFIVDTTVTLLRRMFLRARWYEAHRSHAYQHAAQAFNSHAKVTLAVAAINIGWLFPLAWAASRYQQAAPILAAVAVVPLVYMTFRFEGGRERLSSRFVPQD